MKVNKREPELSCFFDIDNMDDQIIEKKRDIDKGGANGFLHEINMVDGINIGYYNIYSENAGGVTIQNQTPYFQLSFNLTGKKTYSTGKEHKPVISFGSLQYNYLWMEKGLFQLNWPAHHKLETFEVGLKKELFEHILPMDHPFRERLSVADDSTSGALPLVDTNLPLTAEYSAILFNILKCPLDGHLKRLYIHAKTVELVTLQLEQYKKFNSTGSENVGLILSKEEIDRMYLARDIILKNSNLPCRLIDLAHNIGTNDSYLKKHFKIVFGTTVFSFLMEHKMNNAKIMLKDGVPISKVAQQTGYNQTSHFSRAFKRHFGYSPIKAKK